MRPHITRLAAASLAMALLLSACTDTDSDTDSGRSQGTTEPAGESWPSLEPSASFEVPEVGRAIAPAVRTHEDLVIVAGEQRILALDGPAEEAWLQHATRPADDTFPSQTEARVLARHGNVEIDVEVWIRPDEGRADMSPHQDAVVRAAEAALADAVAGLDADD